MPVPVWYESVSEIVKKIDIGSLVGDVAPVWPRAVAALEAQRGGELHSHQPALLLYGDEGRGRHTVGPAVSSRRR